MFNVLEACWQTSGVTHPGVLFSPQNTVSIPRHWRRSSAAKNFARQGGLWLVALMLTCLATLTTEVAAQHAGAELFAPDNLVAWCIVPFDANKRTPEQRAAMVERLGLHKVAYDWREEHVASFEEEILAYQRHGIEYFAFWDEHPAAFALFEKYQLHPQIWKMIPQPPETLSVDERIAAAGRALMPLVARTREMQCKLGLYNHGGWAGEPATMAAVCEWLREHGQADHVGIVYNFHHGHAHIAHFQESLTRMLPFLICVNINGMNANEQPKILGVGQGEHERHMLRILADSGYDGPIGVLDHREQLDAEMSLRENLVGLARIRADWQQP